MPMMDDANEPGVVSCETCVEQDPTHTAAQSATILIVEDDEGNRLLVRRVLEEQGHRVLEADDGPSALHAAAHHHIDLVVLDLGLPGLDGLGVLGRIRETKALPVLLLTARSSEPERVAGLDAGADDYMVKPYSVSELGARVRALLRRSTPQPTRRFIELEELSIDLEAHRIFVATSAVDLTPKEFAIVAFLAKNAPKTFSREALLQSVWGSTTEWQDPATVTEHVRRIRTKLADAGVRNDPITTVRGYGYRIATGE